MSYDLYCYKSQLGRPDIEEAQRVLEIDEDDENKLSTDNEEKLKIAKALINFNPKLEHNTFKFDEISKLYKISIHEAKQQFRHIELNTPDREPATQIIIFDDNVSITVPYWYSGNVADDLFKKVDEYTKIIRKTAGYFVYDPQNETVYDPLATGFDGKAIYTNVTDEVAKLKNSQPLSPKPWWKFW